MDNMLVTSSLPIDARYQESNEEIEFSEHFHNSYEIIYVVKGNVEYTIYNKKYLVKDKSLIFINHMEKHHLKVLTYPYVRYFILIKPEYFKTIINEPVLSSIFKNRTETFNHVIKFNENQCESIEKIIKNIHDELTKKEDFWEYSIKSHLHYLFITLYRNYKHYFPINHISDSISVVLEIQKYIEEHYLEPINLQDVSGMFFRDMFYISHLFKKVTGFTFKQYLLLQRVSKAKELLFYTDDDVTTVCMNSGFNNVNHFIRIFKKLEGITPYQYRKKFR